MGNILRVLKRDILRLIKTPPAMVVFVALLILPSVYTWYNVVGFWDPYENTGDLRVSVVNEDVGGSSDLTGELHVGDMIVEELEKNKQLDWVFSDRETAMADLESGKSYAIFIIPESLTADLLSLTTGDFTKPDIQYLVNEKLSPVSPKITDTGATTLDETINSTFVSTVSDVAVRALEDGMADSKEAVDAAKSQADAKAQAAIASIGSARSLLDGVAAATKDASDQAAQASQAILGVKTGLGDAAESLGTIASLTADLQSDLLGFAGTAMPSINAGLSAVSGISSQANAAIGQITSDISSAQGSVDAALGQAGAVVSQSEQLASFLRSRAEALPDSDPAKATALACVASLEQANASARGQLESLSGLSGQIADASQTASDAAQSLDDAVQQTVDSMGGFSEGLFGTTIPALSESLGELQSSALSLKSALGGQQALIDQTSALLGQLSEVLTTANEAVSQTEALLGDLESGLDASALGGQQALIDQTSALLGQLSEVLTTANEAVSQTEALLGDLESGLDAVRVDLAALGASSALGQLADGSGLDAGKIAEFMGAPTQVETEQLYPLNAYGSAMAPLFMNLTFWIGAFMLLVIMKQEVDSEGIRRLTLTQRYVGRFLLLAIMAVLQAVICCAGVLMLGVQAVNVPALFFAAIVCSLAYLSIIYALSVTLQHIGKGICIILVFAQIPGATGLYPIEMTPPFFQAVYPVLPFTYGIGAMREAICGFYGTEYASCIGMLLFFFLLAMALGILVRPLMSNTNRMAADQVRESDLYVGENVELPVRAYRFSQILNVLFDRDEFRGQLLERRARFMRWYPRFIRGSIVIAIAAPVVLALVFALTPAEKVVVLTVWLASLVALMVFLVVLESLRYGFDRQLQLEGMSEEDLIGLYGGRNAMARAAAEPAAAAVTAVDAGCDCALRDDAEEKGDGRA